MALLVAVGVDEEGYREVLAAEPAGWKRKEPRRNPLKGQIERGLRGVRLGHPSIGQVLTAALPGVGRNASSAPYSIEPMPKPTRARTKGLLAPVAPR